MISNIDWGQVVNTVLSIVIVSIPVIALSIHFSNVQRTIAEGLLDLAANLAKQTPNTQDDELVSKIRKIYDLLNADNTSG